MDKRDWHPADVIAALKKKGTTLAAVSREAGLASSTLGNALARHWPKGERLIAEALNLPPAEIWPSRYSEPAYKDEQGGHSASELGTI
ncbi:helix-turn-helix domain-containing protein [Serratia plymuthica]|uniref:helix-turn-helix domain-containing protein n=1 Tax=Serratia plymuthica TaxID=82996 RepID=UPI001BAF3B37|nr:helix-turn-helix transcriptional regulator [Serratia plymuthica]QUY50978.1 helix-turn-helix domain-containing protein [Serratia plymuthica]